MEKCEYVDRIQIDRIICPMWRNFIGKRRFKAVRQHSLQYGRGTLQPQPRSLRMRVEDKQLDHFLSYITSPYVIQDVPFGQRYLSSGKILETPNVIRTMIPNTLVKQHQAYCEETEFTPFSPTTMLGVLSARPSEGLRFDSSWGLRIFSLSALRSWQDEKHLS